MITPETIINSLEEAIIVFDRTHRITYLNRAAEELFGRSSSGLIGRDFTQVLRGEKTIAPLINKTISEGRSFRGKSVSVTIGAQVNLDFNLSPFFVENRIEGAVLSLFKNINIAEREDNDFDSMVYLIGSIAHEIKNPLGGIKGAAQLLRQKARDGSIDEYTDLIIRETDRLNAILHDYLTMCKKPSFSPVNIHEVIEKSLSVLNLTLKKSGTTLKRHYDPSLPLINGDEGKLLQVFLNIVKNAVESMKKGGTIEITTSPSNESVREGGKIKRWALIMFSDTGKGIPDEDMGRIFLPFYTKKKGGTGIGLALSKKIIKDHKGLIKVKSRQDRGTSFLIYLPFGQNG
ncbi:MAG: PAS domain-containing protein [Nitrospirae bacterium]|nr:PAS domain-containing protein [Nitrospirota bacterium]